MATLAISNLDDDVKARLRVRAAGAGRSMEEEARRSLKSALSAPEEPRGRKHLAELIRARFNPLGGVELDLPREPVRELPDFSGPKYDR